MQHKHLFLPLRALACAALTLTAAQAAELGDITPRSYIGQPLAADIELTSLTPEEVNGLQVRLAIPDVYRGANVVMNPALSTVRMSVVRSGAKQYLHVTTARAVDADYVHVYVELGVPGRMDVRLATVWLQHDPNPAPPPPPPAPAVPLATQMTAAQADQIAAQARADRVAKAATAAKAVTTTAVSASATAATTTSAAASGSAAAVASGAGAIAAGAPGASSAMGPAAASAPARVRNKPAPLPSPLEAEAGRPDSSKASTAQALAASVPEGPPRRIAGVLVSASGKPIKPTIEDDSANGAVPLKVAQALLPLPPLPLPKGVKRAAPISCPPGGMTASECVALDKHNEELSSKITELEGKLKALQGAMGGAPAARGGAQAQSAGAAPHGAAMAAATAAGAATAQAAAKGAAVSAQPAAGAQAIAAKGATSAPPAAGASAAANGGASAQKAADAHAGKSGEASKAGVALGGTAGAGGASAGGASTGGASAGAAGGDGGKGAAGGKSDPHAAKDGVASASLSAKGDTEMHAAQAGAGGASASAAAAVMEAEAASVPPVPTKKIRVLPKLKYKKEKPVNQPTDYTLPLVAGGVGLLALLGAGYIYLRKKNAGKGPLKIWQGFRKKKEPTLEEASPLEEVKPESFAEQ